MSSTISLFYRGKPISEKDGKQFVDLINKKAARADWNLSEDEIRQLRGAMGQIVGDNQFTNPADPLFRIEQARVRTFDGKPVLEVRGQYLDADGKPARNFNGVYIPVDASGTKIQEVMLQSHASRDFSPLLSQFDATLRSIRFK